MDKVVMDDIISFAVVRRVLDHFSAIKGFVVSYEGSDNDGAIHFVGADEIPYSQRHRGIFTRRLIGKLANKYDIEPHYFYHPDSIENRH